MSYNIGNALLQLCNYDDVFESEFCSVFNQIVHHSISQLLCLDVHKLSLIWLFFCSAKLLKSKESDIRGNSKNLNVIKSGHWKEKGRRKIANESTKNASLSQHGWTSLSTINALLKKINLLSAKIKWTVMRYIKGLQKFSTAKKQSN